MSFYALLAFCATTLVLAAAQDLELPVQPCKHDSPDYSSCLRLSIQEAWPNIVTGLPKFDLPILDPFFIEQQRTLFETDETRMDITVKNANTYGLAKARFLAVRPQYSDDFFKVEVDIHLPKMFIEGEYTAEGAVGSWKLGGDGFFNVSMEDIKVTWVVEGPVANDRWTIAHVYLYPEIGNMKIWFSNLFNGNEELNNTALKFVNEYWPSLYRTILPFVEKNWDEGLSELANRIFSKVSFSKTFP